MDRYKQTKYHPMYKLSTDIPYEIDISKWQERIQELNVTETLTDDIIEKHYRLVDSATKSKVDKHSDQKNITRELIEHHKDEIRKLLVQREHENLLDLRRKGLHTWEVDGVKIPLNPEWNNVCVMLSGGADSACLTFNLCKLIQEHRLKIKVHVITGTRVWKSRPWAGPISKEVYQWLKDRFPKIIGERYNHFVPPYFEHSSLGNAFDGKPGEAIILSEYIDYICNSNKYDAVYDATTLNPKDYKGDRMESRDEGTAKILANPKDKYWKLGPLQTTSKDWVIKQYKDNDILDLLKTTRSCEGDAYMSTAVYGYDWRWYENNKDVPECGRCFWCKEKQWAMEVNGVEL